MLNNKYQFTTFHKTESIQHARNRNENRNKNKVNIITNSCLMACYGVTKCELSTLIFVLQRKGKNYT